MEKRGKLIILLIVTALLLLLVIFIYIINLRSEDVPAPVTKGTTIKNKTIEDKPEPIVNDTEPVVGGTMGGSSTGGAGGSSSGGTTTSSGTESGLPSDIDTRPCGFYFGEYDVCTGVCPSGVCIQQESSCYCKKI